MIVDQNDAPLPGVTVEANSTNLQGSRIAVTSNDGRYRFVSLPPGNYTVTASLAGLGSASKSTTVALDSTATVNLRLELSAKEAITVTGEAPIIDTTSTTGGTNYTSAVISKLPVNRNYTDIIKSNPGVNTDQGDTQGRALALTVYGATSVENQFIIDGVNTTNVIRGFQGKAINAEFIQEVEIKTGGYPAEYGRALGGVVNVITKSGGNEYHGDGFVYYDSFGMRATQVVNDQDYFQGMEISAYNRTDVGFGLGGRIIKDRLWFYAAYDHASRPADVSRFNDSELVPASEKFPADSNENLYSGKLTWNIATGTTLVGTIFADPSKVTGASPSDPTHTIYPIPIVNPDASTWQAALNIGGTDYGLRLNQLFGSTALLTAQGSRHYDRYQTTPSAAGAGIQLQDWTCAGGTAIDPCDVPPSANSAEGGFGAVTGYLRNNYSTRWQANANLSLYLGNNEIRVGGDYMDGKTTAITNISGQQFIQKYNEYGQVYYAHNFWSDTTTESALTPVDNTVSPNTINTSFFLQDSWKILPGLTLNAGIRWDHENLRDYLGQSVITLTNEWQPRIGVVWDPGKDGKMKVYAFGGRFYYALPTDLNVRSYGQQISAISYNFDSGTDVTQNPNVIGHEHAFIQGGAFAEPHDNPIKGIYQDEYSVGFEMLIDPTFSVGVKGEYRNFGRAVEDRCDADSSAPENDGNTCVIGNPGGSGQFGSGDFTGCNGLDGDAYECGINPINSLLPPGTPTNAKRLYRGIEFLVRKTFTDKLWLQASYVYSSLRGNYDGEVKQDYQQTDPGITADFDYNSFLRNRYGRLYLDRPSNFRLDASYVTPWKLWVGVQGWAQSGAPISQYGYFNAGYGAQTSLVPNGSYGRLPTTWEGNISLGYPIQIGPVTVSVLAYLFNIFNNQIKTNVDTQWQVSQGLNYPKSPDQYNQLFWAPCTAAQASDPVANQCNENTNPNYLKNTSRQAPRLFRAAIKVSF
jgi:outer membrane receptor protein involved in Fe transport